MGGVVSGGGRRWGRKLRTRAGGGRRALEEQEMPERESNRLWRLMQETRTLTATVTRKGDEDG